MMSPAEQAHANRVERLRRELGPVVMAALDDPRVVEIMLNPDGKLWVERAGEGRVHAGELDAVSAKAAFTSLATIMDRDITAEDPFLECELPIGGNRFAGSIQPVTRKPTFAIRKRATLIFTLDDYVTSGILSAGWAQYLREAVHAKKNILVVGGTGSGKTTFCNALLHEMAGLSPSPRVVLIEDRPELQCPVEDRVELLTSRTVSLRDLLKFTLNIRPDRIVIGETRDATALDLVKAWGTGHPGGVTTVHANNAKGGVRRLEQLIREAGVEPDKEFLAEVVNVVTFITKTAEGRKVTELLEITGCEQGQYQYAAIAAEPSQNPSLS